MIVSLMTARPLEYAYSPCTAVIQYSSTSHGSVISLVNCAIYVHSDLKTSCVSNPHIELDLETSIVHSGRVLSEMSRSRYSWQMFKLGRVISLMNARPLEYRNSL